MSLAHIVDAIAAMPGGSGPSCAASSTRHCATQSQQPEPTSPARRTTAHRVATQHNTLQRTSAEWTRRSNQRRAAAAAQQRRWSAHQVDGEDGAVQMRQQQKRAPTRRAPSTPAVRPAAGVARRRAGGARKALHAARRVTARVQCDGSTRGVCLTCTARSHMLRAARWFAHCSSTLRAPASGSTDLASSTDSANAPTPCTAHHRRCGPVPWQTLRL